jgi:hypothetical protein
MDKPWSQLIRDMPTVLLIQELERREEQERGAWTGEQERRILELAQKLNPPPIQS